MMATAAAVTFLPGTDRDSHTRRYPRRQPGPVEAVLDPALRGRGLAAPAMAAVVRLAQAMVPTVSLYVNDYNLPARATYARVGFQEVGAFATVHY